MNISRTIGIIGFDGVTALDIFGPAEVFQTAASLKNGTYRLKLLSSDGRPFMTEAGIRVAADADFANAPPLDTVLVPGGEGIRQPEALGAISNFLRVRASDTRRLVSVCTGLYALAESGLLSGRRATTHWRFADKIAARFPDIDVQSDAIYIVDPPVYSSAGVTAGIDLSLALVEADHDRALALRVARELVVYMKRSGGQRQYAEPLKIQSISTDRFATVTTWIAENLAADLSVSSLAQRACLSERQFSRAWRSAFGKTPAQHIELLRVEEARQRLNDGCSIASVANALGFRSEDVFRRAFERHFGLTPSMFRSLSN